jgi:hypothetical protein
VARLTGLEPATPGVTGRYSNQLSYNRPLSARVTPNVWGLLGPGPFLVKRIWRGPAPRVGRAGIGARVRTKLPFRRDEGHGAAERRGRGMDPTIHLLFRGGCPAPGGMPRAERFPVLTDRYGTRRTLAHTGAKGLGRAPYSAATRRLRAEARISLR